MRAIAGRRIVQIMYQDCVLWKAIFLDFAGQGLRGIGSIVRARFFFRHLRSGHVGLDLNFARDGLRFANLRGLI